MENYRQPQVKEQGFNVQYIWNIFSSDLTSIRISHGTKLLNPSEEKKILFFLTCTKETQTYITHETVCSSQQRLAASSQWSVVVSVMFNVGFEIRAYVGEREKQGIDKIFVFSRLTRNRLHANNRPCSTHM